MVVWIEKWFKESKNKEAWKENEGRKQKSKWKKEGWKERKKKLSKIGKKDVRKKEETKEICTYMRFLGS